MGSSQLQQEWLNATRRLSKFNDIDPAAINPIMMTTNRSQETLLKQSKRETEQSMMRAEYENYIKNKNDAMGSTFDSRREAYEGGQFTLQEEDLLKAGRTPIEVDLERAPINGGVFEMKDMFNQTAPPFGITMSPVISYRKQQKSPLRNSQKQ